MHNSIGISTKEVVQCFTRMLDNVVEINGLPLKVNGMKLNIKRRHGMGYLGLVVALSMLGETYSEASIALLGT